MQNARGQKMSGIGKESFHYDLISIAVIKPEEAIICYQKNSSIQALNNNDPS
jgi:hypothetical protein